MNFCIRQADQNDAAALAEILTRSWKETYAHILPPAELESAADKERYADVFTVMAQNPANTFYIAHCGGIPCGMLLLCPARDTDLPGFAEIVALYTLQKYWGCGLGKELTKTALDNIKLSFSGIVLWTFRDNTRARRFYEKFGFTPDGKQKQENFSNKPWSVRYINPLSYLPG